MEAKARKRTGVVDTNLLAEWFEAVAGFISTAYKVTRETTGWPSWWEEPAPEEFIVIRIDVAEGEFCDTASLSSITCNSRSVFDGETLDIYINPTVTPRPQATNLNAIGAQLELSFDDARNAYYGRDASRRQAQLAEPQRSGPCPGKRQDAARNCRCM
jgi:hypothetical protein